MYKREIIGILDARVRARGREVVVGKPTTVGQELFAWDPKPWEPKTFKNFNTAKTSACNQVLVEAMNNFDIKAWALARLLGLPWLQHIYKWLDGTQRPSQMYMTRLCKLYSLKAQGLEIDEVHHIDWNGTGEIHFKEIISVPGPGEVTPRRQTISPEDQELRDRFMKFTPR